MAEKTSNARWHGGSATENSRVSIQNMVRVAAFVSTKGACGLARTLRGRLVRCPSMARNRPPTMSAIRLLSEGKRTWRLQPNSVEIDPLQTLCISRYSLRETARGGSARAPSARVPSEVCVDSKRAYKSFRYKAKTDWTSARRGTLSASGKSHIVVGSPPEFKGQPDVWAPEELLVGFGQYMLDADFPCARPGERPCSGGI